MYFTSLLATNITVLSLYDLTGEFNFFMLALLQPGRRHPWDDSHRHTQTAGEQTLVFRHAYFMSGSYVGVMAAFVVEIAVRAPGWDFGVAVAVATALVSAVGVYLIATRGPVGD